jgi:secreted PhoX family phosphatase
MTEKPAPSDLIGPPRRQVLRRGLGLGLAALTAGCGSMSLNPLASRTGFGPPAADPAGANEGLSLPAGYVAASLARPGEPLGRGAAMAAPGAPADPASRLGVQHGGVAYFPLDGSRRGLLAISHGCAGAGAGGSAENAARRPLSQGVSVLEVALDRGQWEVVRPSAHAQRISASTPVDLAGPAAGHPLMKTAADPEGRTALGTLANGPGTRTPWGTYLCGERDFAAGFTTADQPTAHERRYGLGRTAVLGWHESDPRFDTVRHPNEPNRHGWLVEIDPTQPAARAVKRTALGRGAHGALRVVVRGDGRAVVYRAEAGPEEHLYRFVSRDAMATDDAGADEAAPRPALLDDGQLYAARLQADGTGHWLPLSAGLAPLDAEAGFADAGTLLIQARQAADRLGASRVGACVALAGGPDDDTVYVALAPTPGHPDGRILCLREGPEPDRFEWSPLAVPEGLGAGPECMALDDRGRLWLGGDMPAEGPPTAARPVRPRGTGTTWVACDMPGSPARRFLAAPGGGRASGMCWTPDGRTMFLNLRAGTVAVRRSDGGPIGA